MKKVFLALLVVAFVVSGCGFGDKFERLGDDETVKIAYDADPLDTLLNKQIQGTQAMDVNNCAVDCEGTKIIAKAQLDLLATELETLATALDTNLRTEVVSKSMSTTTMSTTTTTKTVNTPSAVTLSFLIFETVIPTACNCDKSLLDAYRDILKKFAKASGLTCNKEGQTSTANSIYLTILPESSKLNISQVLVRNFASKLAIMICDGNVDPCKYEQLVSDEVSPPAVADCSALNEKAQKLYELANRGEIKGAEFLLELDALVRNGGCSCSIDKLFTQEFLKSYLYKYFFNGNDEYIMKAEKICSSGTNEDLLAFLDGEFDLKVDAMDENFIRNIFCNAYTVCVATELKK